MYLEHIESLSFFYFRLDYQQLVYCSLASITNRRFELLKPTIIKPVELWTGKQVRQLSMCTVLGLCYFNISLTSCCSGLI